MTALKYAKVFRGGVTSPYISFEGSSVELELADDGSVCLWTSIDSKGGGKTRLKITLSPADLETILSELVCKGGVAELSRLLLVLQRSSVRLHRELGDDLLRMASASEREYVMLDREVDRLRAESIGWERWVRIRAAARSVASASDRIREFVERLGPRPPAVQPKGRRTS